MKNQILIICVFLTAVQVTLQRKIKNEVEGFNDIDNLEEIGEDLDDVIETVDDVIARRHSQDEREEVDDDEMLDQRLEMLSEDAGNLQREIFDAVDEADKNGEDSRNFRRRLGDIEADSVILAQDTMDVVDDFRFEKRDIKTRLDITFDRDLGLLKNETLAMQKEVQNLMFQEGEKERKRKSKRRRKGKKDKRRRGKSNKKSRKLGKSRLDSLDKFLSNDSLMMSDTPTWRDPRYDDAARRRASDNRLAFDEAARRRESSNRLTSTSRDVTRANSRYFDTYWLESYMKNCKNCITTTRESQCPMSSEALEMKKWATELQQLLSFGCVKPEGCKSKDTCCVNKEPAFSQTMVQITQMLKDVYNMLQKQCKDCVIADEPQEIRDAWTQWGSWSNCDVTCGRGVQTRFRQCSSPAPKRDCVGQPREIRQCPRLPNCCVDDVWTSWTQWSACSATCGPGVKRRSRSCKVDPYSSCGNRCEGPKEERASCNSGRSCCVDGNWSSWAQYGECSVTCGRGQVLFRRRCDSPAANECGRPCPGPAEQRRACGRGQCCVDGNWSSWEKSGECSVTCGRGQVLYRRRCDSPAPNECGRSCPGLAQQMRACGQGNECCVDGNWASWGSWTRCSVTCGSGIQSRMRRCSNPSPNFCGMRCPGPARERKQCNERQCCVDGNWSSWGRWSTCSVTCGRGSRERRRYCSNPRPSECGRTCPGDAVERDVCEGQACCADANWSSWSSWSTCSSSCGTGTRYKTRTCTSRSPECRRSCEGDARETERCSNPVVNGNWGSWESWERCSVTCGIGTKKRRRRCNNPARGPCGRPCSGDRQQTAVCDSQRDCCVDGNWGSWRAWSQCSVTCGRGMRERQRVCNDPSPNYCGEKCPGSANDRESCDSGVPCRVCVDGNWGSWRSWSSCSGSCGRGLRERRRVCDNPAANYCGEECPGPANERDSCETGVPCCVDGNWSPWQTWSSCSGTCGRGARERRRVCNNPSPNYCGEKCPGPASDRDSCDTGRECCVDGNWSPWQTWSSCSGTCGRGARERRRVCNNPSPNYCGEKCPGPSSDRDSCDTGRECCVDGNWSSWQPWSQCSSTCGQGTIERRRSCDNPPANACGKRCEGWEFETDVCETGKTCQVCVDGNWGSWQSWSQCSATCGRGFTERMRSCDNPPANYCGEPCPGPRFESEMCDSQVPCVMCVDGNWSPWSQWSQCSATCSYGFQHRERRCSNPAPNICGSRCPGDPKERRSCQESQYCECEEKEWTQWGPWSSCSATCGLNTYRSRSRLCRVVRPGNDCGYECPGLPFERDTCVDVPMCPNWGPWSACSATCRGEGTRTRVSILRETNLEEFEAKQTETETERCQADGPDCPTWGPWSSCSATCRGRGFRERIIVYMDDIGVLINATRSEREVCQVDGPDCDSLPPADAAWTQWDSWCPCSCKHGVRSRRRKCERETGAGEVVTMPLALCNGDARQNEYCDVSKECPGCITDCVGQRVGEYPSCSGCNIYLICSANFQTNAITCSKANTEYDAFTRQCVPPPSPSCALHDCVSSCAGKEDGKYHACSSCYSYVRCNNGQMSEVDCPTNMEWNQHRQRCMSEKSPTCKREYIPKVGAFENTRSIIIGGALNTLVKLTTTATPVVKPRLIIGGAINTWARDAPASRYANLRPPPGVGEGGTTYTETNQQGTGGRGGTSVWTENYKNMDGTGRDGQSYRYTYEKHSSNSRGTMHTETNQQGTGARGGTGSGTVWTSGYNQVDGTGRDGSSYYSSNQKYAVDGREGGTVYSGTNPQATGGRVEGTGSRTQWTRVAYGTGSYQSSITGCLTSCRGVAPGKYPSCISCSDYVICTQHGRLRQRKCGRNRQWDNATKRCQAVSTTCRN